MRTRLGFAAYVLALLLAACGDDLDAETLIGATCDTSEDCDVTGVCVRAKGGLCSRACANPGSLQECPLDSYCHSQEVATDDESRSAMTLCFPACREQRECRDGYRCKGVSAGPGKVCVPEK